MLSHLELLVQIVNARGTESNVTLLVQGRIVSGILTPNKRFGKWAGEILRGAADGKTQLPVTTTPRMTNEEAKAIRDDWNEYERHVLELHPGGKATEVLDHAYEECCLRDAKVYGTTVALSVTDRYNYLMVDMASVSAFTLGLYEASRAKADVDPASD